jgi:hypothetical protein
LAVANKSIDNEIIPAEKTIVLLGPILSERWANKGEETTIPPLIRAKIEDMVSRLYPCSPAIGSINCPWQLMIIP